MNLWIWVVLTIAPLLGFQPLGSAVSLQLQANEGQFRSLLRIKQILARAARSVKTKAYLIALLLSLFWIATIALCYELFTPRPTLPPPGDRSNYDIVLASCMVDPVRQADLATFLGRLGFSNARMRVNAKDHRVSGTAMASTVYFYHSTTEGYAKAIAAELNSHFGQHYTAIHGDGEGIRSNRFRYTFVIQDIAQPCELTK